MATELTITSPAEQFPRSTGIIWGPAKSGKTTLLATLPGKKLIINVDPDGYESVSFRSDYKVIDLSGHSHKDICAAAEKVVPSMIEKELDDFQPGDSVFFDSLSSLGWAALNAAIINQVGKSRDFTPSIEAPGLSAYGARTNYIVSAMRNTLRATKQRNLHCWFTAHMDTPTTNKQGDFLYQSMTLSENGVTQTSLSISEIWFMDRDNKKQTLAIQPVRGRKPMGTRMFRLDDVPEFEIKYNIDEDDSQMYSMATWWRMYLANNKHKLPVPGSPDFLKLYKQLPKE